MSTQAYCTLARGIGYGMSNSVQPVCRKRLIKSDQDTAKGAGSLQKRVSQGQDLGQAICSGFWFPSHISLHQAIKACRKISTCLAVKSSCNPSNVTGGIQSLGVPGGSVLHQAGDTSWAELAGCTQAGCTRRSRARHPELADRTGEKESLGPICRTILLPHPAACSS